MSLSTVHLVHAGEGAPALVGLSRRESPGSRALMYLCRGRNPGSRSRVSAPGKRAPALEVVSTFAPER